MVKSCCAVGCSNRYSKDCGISFYRFPENKERRAKWIAAIGRKDWTPGGYSWICSQHFIRGKSDDPASPDYIPSVFKHTKEEAKRKALTDLERYDRLNSCKKKRLECTERQEAARTLLELAETGNGVTYCEPHTGVGTMTEEYSRCQECVRLGEKCENLKEENEVLKSKFQQLQKEYDELQATSRHNSNGMHISGFERDDGMVRYYTGLPCFAILMAVFRHVVGNDNSTVSHHNNNREALPYFQQFIMVLMKLRLNLGDQDLGYRFRVSQPTVSRYMTKWVNGMYLRMNPMIRWPCRDVLRKTMPMEFRKHFRSCAVIIDCFEVFLERPSSLKARAQTWSNYKHHNTVKFLIGIAPQGVITYVSKGWGGRVSDLHLTNNCGFLLQLMPGDCILADRGFTIQEGAGLYCAEVKIPPFTRGKRQLDKIEIEKSRQLSSVRIHVERVIGLVRQKYLILNSTLPINFVMCKDEDGLSMIDKVITICSVLCNCCNSVVPFE